MANTNTAIDFDRFRNSAENENIRVVSEDKTPKRSQVKRPPYLKYGVLAVCLFVAVMLLVGKYMLLTEVTSVGNHLKVEIEQLKGEQKALEAKKEELYNLAIVEQIAIDEGMIKLDRDSITYLDLSNKSKATILNGPSQPSSVLSGLVRSFNAVVEYLN